MAFKRLFKTTAFRLIAIYLAVMLIASMIIGLYISWKTTNLINHQLLETIAAEVKGLAEQYKIGGTRQLAKIVSSRSLRPGNNLYYLGSLKGQLIAGNINRIPKEILNNTKGAQFEYVWKNDLSDNAPPLKRQAISIPFHVTGDLVLVVGRDIKDQLDYTRATRNIVLLGLAALTLFGLGAGLFVSRNLLNRINSITSTSRTIMAGDLSRRIELKGTGDQLDRLSGNLNSMLERIENLMKGMQDVTDNIAHDLKTPLNRIRIGAETALLENKTPQAQQKALQTTIEEADQLIKTFEAILKISRLEAGIETEKKDRVDLNETLTQLAELYEPVIEEAQMQLKVIKSAPAVILADRQLIAQALSNLLDNAIKYSNPTSNDHKTIELSLYKDETSAMISVADQGPGIGEQDHTRIFDRFTRLEQSRSQKGSGLGLAMVAAITKAYDGTILLKNNKPGLNIILKFPLLKR